LRIALGAATGAAPPANRTRGSAAGRRAGPDSDKGKESSETYDQQVRETV
jgi:hypothetical protein